MAVVASAGLAACGGGDADAVDTAASISETTTPTDAPDVTTPPELPPTTAAPETTTTVPVAPESLIADPDGGCLSGSWSINDDELTQYYDAVFAANDFGVAGTPSVSVEGAAYLVTDGAEFTYTPEYVVTVSIAGFEALATPSGAGSGTYVPSDGRLRAAIVDSDLDLVVELDGTVIDAGAFGEGIFDPAPFVDGPYDCDAGPSLGFSVGADGDVWHPVTLTTV